MSSILLADDNPHAQRMGSQILSQEGHTVITVSDGDEAMLHLEENIPDLVMVDTRMPGPSGFEICKHVKSQPKFHAVKVVLLAGPLEPFDTAEAESAGPDGVLHKPLDAYTLIDTVNSLLGQGADAVDQNAAAQINGDADKNNSAAAKSAIDTEESTAGKALKFELPHLKRSAPDVTAPAAAALKPQPPARPAVAEQTRSRDTVPAAAASSTATATAVASGPNEALAELSDTLSDHLTSVVEQALGTEDSQHRQRHQVETIVREVLEAALPAIIEQITDRVMASLDH